MANGVEIGKAFITIVPTFDGAQSEITKELTGITTPAAEEAGKEGGSSFGNNLAAGIKAASATIAAAVAAATAAAVALGKEFIEAANATAEYGDTVDKTATKLGVSKKFFQELDYVMQLNGSSASEVSVGFKTLQNKIADATSGNASALKSFEDLGISLEDLQNLSTEEIFMKTVSSLQGLEEGATKASASYDLFGKSGQNMANLLAMDSSEMENAIDLANEYGIIMDDSAVEASADYIDALTTMKATFKGLTNSLMSEFLPSLTMVMDGLSAIFAGDEGGIAMIQEGISGVIDNIASVSPQLFELVNVIVTSLIAGFGPMLPQLVSSIFTFLNSALSMVAGLIPQLTPVITDGVKGVCSALLDSLPLIIKALIDLVKDIVIWLASDGNVKTLVDGIMQLVSILSTSLSDALPILLPAIIDIIGQVAVCIMSPENVQMILNSCLYIVGAIVMALVASLPSIGGVIVNYFGNIYNLIMSFGSQIIGWLSPFINGIGNTVSGWLSWIQGAIVNAFNWISSVVTGWLWGIQTGFSDAFNNVLNGVSNIIGSIQGLANDIFNTLASIPDQVVSIGENIVNGLINGVTNKNSSIISTMQNMASNALNAAKQKLGIASPSKAFSLLGGYSAEGFGIGFDDKMADVEKDMADTFGGLTGNMSAEITANSPEGAAYGSAGDTYNGGNISINVYGAEGQDVNSLAETIAYKLEEMTTRRSAVYG